MKRKTTEWHGMSHTPEYKLWDAMIQRCENPKNRHYKNYGARGIRVCARWRDSFQAFISDVGMRPSPHLTLDRRNNDRGYEPGNVRWSTRKEQQRNRRVTKLTPAKVARIRRLAAKGHTFTSLATKFGIAGQNISAVVNRRIWA